MQLENLIAEVGSDIIQVFGKKNIEVTGIASDSRNVLAGYAFLAIKGQQVDGKDYINKAIDLGAKAIFFDGEYNIENLSITYIQVKDTSEILGKIASKWYGNPSTCLNLVGITGTNGKTTTATLLYNLFIKLGYKAGLISTVCNYVYKDQYASTHTTPDPIQINDLLSKMVDEGCDYAFMEVSSHAISQYRINGLCFRGGIFTNLTQDHLDYHGTMKEYLQVKKRFFDNLPSTAFALTNLDDKNGMVMLQNTKASKKTYSVKSLADFKGRIIEKHFNGTLLEINKTELEVNFVGIFNVYNLLAVYGAAILLGQKSDDVLLIMSTLNSVSGRFEIFRSEAGVTAIVDYAHTPDALINVLDTIHDVLEGKGKVISVVGCGGNRDKSKRPLMAKEAITRSDQVLITSDNPRFEDPQVIIDHMMEGLSPSELKKTISIVDRQQAIKTACTLAHKGDVILIAGKGHEDYQEIKGVKHHFDDREVIKTIFEINL